jgi:hypothetical protein
MTTILDRLAAIDALVVRYYEHNLAEEAKAKAERAQEECHTWQARRGAELDESSKAFDAKLAEYEAARSRLDLSKQNLEAARSRMPVADYNLEVAKHNQLVERCSQLGEAFEAIRDRHNAEVEAFNKEQESRMHALESLITTANKEILDRNRWQQGDGGTRLWVEINQLYAQVRNQPAEASGGEVGRVAKRLKEIRRSLGEWARAQQRARASGLLLECCRLGGRTSERAPSEAAAGFEECFMLVDSGATMCTISPEMVKILQLERLQDEEVEISLPNNIRVRAPQILLPAVETHGCEARFVEGVVLQEATPGIDGIVGLSFLNKFEYQLTKDSRSETGGIVPSLTLAAPQRPVVSTPGGFDVFICYKTEDREHAITVYEALTKHGKRPFLSEVSLEGKADFGQMIEFAIEAADHLVLVTSSRKNADAPWVRREWRIFEELILGGEKRESNIVTVMCSGMDAHQLPPPLRRFQAISKAEASWPARLMQFLPKIS